MLYFDHSTTAATDSRIAELCIECGCGAVAAFWVIMEQIYRDETGLVLFENQAGNRPVTKVFSHWLNVDENQLMEWVSAMLEIGLLEMDESKPGAVTNKRAVANIEAYREKCETARQNGKRGGRKPTQKPKANQAGNQTLTDPETGRKTNKTKQNKGFGLDKPNQKPNASGVAAAAKAAPPAAPEGLVADGWEPCGVKCRKCGAHMLKAPNGDVACPHCEPMRVSIEPPGASAPPQPYGPFQETAA